MYSILFYLKVSRAVNADREMILEIVGISELNLKRIGKDWKTLFYAISFAFYSSFFFFGK